MYAADETGTLLLANGTQAAFHDTSVDALEGAHISAVLDELTAALTMTQRLFTKAESNRSR
ncbi:hypothetical protein [Halorubrum yunnanense]|uniref:hypothetical protein n=1 Tax=Halorubrum yunnanense TaxID=1526162 RepID=UPI002270A6AF|nr:hypothetical protein [Halorubrum yunnanense]